MRDNGLAPLRVVLDMTETFSMNLLQLRLAPGSHSLS